MSAEAHTQLTGEPSKYLGAYLSTGNPDRKLDEPLAGKNIILLTNEANIETVLHEMLHQLIDDHFVRSRQGRLHPRYILALQLRDQAIRPGESIETYLSRISTLIVQKLILHFREEIAVRLILLHEAQRLGLTPETQDALERQIFTQLKSLEKQFAYSKTIVDQFSAAHPEVTLDFSKFQDLWASLEAEVAKIKTETEVELKLREPPAAADSPFERLGESLDHFDLERAKKTYRRLALKYHPDRNPNDPESEALFKRYGDAWEIVSDSSKLTQYLMGVTLQKIQERRRDEERSYRKALDQAALPWARFFTANIFGGIAAFGAQMFLHPLPWYFYAIGLPLSGFFLPEIEEQLAKHPGLSSDQKVDIFIRGGLIRGLAAVACGQIIAALATGQIIP